MSKPNPFRYFKTSPAIIRLAVMMYVRFPLSLRNVEDLLHERGIEIGHETVRFWWNRLQIARESISTRQQFETPTGRWRGLARQAEGRETEGADILFLKAGKTEIHI